MLQVIKRLSAQSADVLGISASLLCMVHCLAFPLFISVGYIFQHGEEPGHDHWHFVDYLFIGLALWAVFHASKNTQSKGIKIALWIAVIVFSISVSLHDLAPWMVFVSVASSLALVIFHILNWKFHRKCNVIRK
ncbi:MerC domain-containing protein [Rhodonellum sp.]|uniref:MerC domain-containing protein n=1 Tax=Rhodonellum sp. TaxID=2231180 RepID=UPI0027174A7D|nr:MerC domain-containing protein [Rhodonellum sp.]MDO9551035.1 MerC domain-containing protein [Rhodonellum sp.]